jgi:hypothetical protein
LPLTVLAQHDAGALQGRFQAAATQDPNIAKVELQFH